MKYIGLHKFVDGSLGVEITRAKKISIANSKMERNDSHLLVIRQSELNRLLGILSYLEEEELEIVLKDFKKKK